MINKDKIKIVLFDIDNTLSYGDKAKEFYSQYSRCLESTLARELRISLQEAINIANEFRKKYNGHGERSFEALGIGMDVWFEAILSLDPQKYLIPLKSSKNLLQVLREMGFILGAITDGPRVQVSRILEAIQVEENQFDFILSWEKGGKMPKYGCKKVYEQICEKYSIKPNEAVMIGDSLETDILPAKEVGLDVIYVSDSDNNQYKKIKNVEELYRNLTQKSVIN